MNTSAIVMMVISMVFLWGAWLCPLFIYRNILKS
ncbi:MetS family NSS transporter small subunit [Acinetobacter pittii]|nr:MetS family NSS transporter small subunit [Acinetobacter pittii]